MTNVTPIRSGFRVRKINHDSDALTISFAKLSRRYAEKADDLAETEAGSEAHRLAAHMIGINQKLPRNNLRCIHSTLDERRDFDLRCHEAEVAKAEHELESRRLDRQRTLEDYAWSMSAEHREWQGEVRRLWEAYRDSIKLMANTPARTRQQLDRKRLLIGKVWLNATSGEWYAELRAGVAADEAWLEEHMPKRRGAAK